jgi:hypothetical protein
MSPRSSPLPPRHISFFSLHSSGKVMTNRSYMTVQNTVLLECTTYKVEFGIDNENDKLLEIA